MLRDLPDTTAAKLIAEMPPEIRQRVQGEIAALVDVDPMEQRRALESFAVSLRHHAAQQSQATSSCLDFLGELSDDLLLSLLRDEHPQTKAVVLAEISPDRAAAILPRLGTAQRQDLLARIGRLPDVPEEMLSELARSFRQRLERLTAEHPSRSSRHGGGNRHDDRYDPVAAAEHLNGSAHDVSPRLQAILAEMPLATNQPDASPAAQSRATTERHLYAAPAHAPTNKIPGPAMSVEQTHRELMQLSPSKLCELLGRVDTRTAILALCGLPSKVADAAIACLPRSQANQVRQHLMSVGSIEIREIDQAKAAVLAAARVAGQAPPEANAASASRHTGAATGSSHGHVAVAM